MNKRSKLAIIVLFVLLIVIVGSILMIRKNDLKKEDVNNIEKYKSNYEFKGEELDLEDSQVMMLYDRIEQNFISDIYPKFNSYKLDNFYMNKFVDYDTLSYEAKLYYAYMTIDGISRRWFSSCDELKGFTFNNNSVNKECIKYDKSMILKDNEFEWEFNNVNKDVLEKAYHELFGYNKTMPLTSFTMNYTGACMYSYENDEFLCFNQAGSVSLVGGAETRLVKAMLNEDVIELYDRYVWLEQNEKDFDTMMFYKSYLNQDELITEEKYDGDYIVSDDIFSQGALYKHSFRKDSLDRYYWVSSERVE